MKPVLLFFALCFLLSSPLHAQNVIAIKVDGSINPVTAGYIQRALDEAQKTHAECLLIELNTPGGLLKSTRVIVSSMLESPVPIVVYVAPAGAHAGSAGVFITLAAHVAAMAPGTNIGAAHPVSMQGQIDSVMNEKATNDAAAFIRTIAEKRSRNLEWAEDAVRSSISITESEAMAENIIDTVALNTQDLLNKIDGRSVTLNSAVTTLHTRQATVQELPMTWVEDILDKISDPNVAYILMLLGIYGLFFELYTPGAILPGIIGGICLILAFYAMHTLPLNYAGLAFIVFAIILFLLEIKITSGGLLAIGGTISLLLGSMMLMKPGSPLEFAQISTGVIIPAVVLSALFFLFVVGMGLRAQKQKPITGIEGMIGNIGLSLDILDPHGMVQVHGEIWQAESVEGKIKKGEKVQVVAVENLKIRVKHFPE